VSDGWYLYGVTHAGVELGDAYTTFDGALPRPFLVIDGEVAAITGKVSLEEFDEARLPDLLNDPGWLIPRATAHQDVLERALPGGPVVPFRFGTVYRDERAVRTFLRSNAHELTTALERLSGRVEMGVKVFADRDVLTAALRDTDAPVAELETEIASAPEGRAYMLRRRADRLLDEAVQQFEQECAAESHAAFSAVADDVAVNPPQPAELSGRSEEMILNGAYLLQSVEAINDVAQELAQRYGGSGVTFDVTGPWPPYNFVPSEFA